MKITDKFVFFYKEVFSQWHMSSFKDPLTATVYNCTEQYMMHKKALVFRDFETAEKIMSAKKPADQKALGRLVRGYNDQKWNEVKFKIVCNGNMLKFTQNPNLLASLLDTGDKTLVEASLKDTIWGIGMYEDTPGVEDPKNWRGENLLGYALTDVRDFLKKMLLSADNLYEI
jgi:ribA/ribD-fused uncharacterized protein